MFDKPTSAQLLMCVSATCRTNRYPQPITSYSTIFKTFDRNFEENVGFGESLKNNLLSKKGNNKDWKRNSLGEIISQENIDSYIEKLNLDSARKKLTDIFEWENLVQNGNATWSEYFTTLKNGTEKYIPDLIKRGCKKFCVYG